MADFGTPFNPMASRAFRSIHRQVGGRNCRYHRFPVRQPAGQPGQGTRARRHRLWLAARSDPMRHQSGKSRRLRLGPNHEEPGLTRSVTLVSNGNRPPGTKPMTKENSQTGHSSDAYALALERERSAWQFLHRMPRSDPQYAQALIVWRAAADRIGVEAEKLIKRHPKLRPVSQRTAAAGMPPPHSD